mmetsp:Transcript_86907/g.186156  ORF Transcript_86907/g.186156 Transcript_86907/m.186156 type:complete len:220 (+) Transcript_86907:235-894(+)
MLFINDCTASGSSLSCIQYMSMSSHIVCIKARSAHNLDASTVGPFLCLMASNSASYIAIFKLPVSVLPLSSLFFISSDSPWPSWQCIRIRFLTATYSAGSHSTCVFSAQGASPQSLSSSSASLLSSSSSSSASPPSRLSLSASLRLRFSPSAFEKRTKVSASPEAFCVACKPSRKTLGCESSSLQRRSTSMAAACLPCPGSGKCGISPTLSGISNNAPQ